MTIFVCVLNDLLLLITLGFWIPKFAWKAILWRNGTKSYDEVVCEQSRRKYNSDNEIAGQR